MQSFKPMIFTFIPIILILGWINAHLAYEPILPGEEFTTTIEFYKDLTGSATIIIPDEIELLNNKEQKIKPETDDGWLWDTEKAVARWKLKSDKKGEYLIQFEYDDQTYKKDVLITDKRNYAEIRTNINDKKIKTLNIDNDKMKPLSFNGIRLGWIWTYIIFSILTNLTLKKILKIH